MKTRLIILFLFAFAHVFAQDPFVKSELKATKRLKAEKDFIWKGDTIKKDSLLYAELTADSVRFKRINGSYTNWLGKSVVGGGSGMVYPGVGLAKSNGVGWATSVADNSGNWNTAYGWGNHALAGYVTGTPWTAMGYLTGYAETDPVVKAINGIVKSNGSTVSAVVSGTDIKTINGVSLLGSGDITTSGSMIYPAAGIPVSTGTTWGTSISDYSANWNTAYGWGNHASVGYVTGTPWTAMGYLTSQTPHTDVVVDGDFISNGILKRTSAGVYDIIADYSASWNTAYGWGNHASVGYVTGTPWTAMGYLTSYTETDPTISTWAKAATKPSYDNIEVGAASVSFEKMVGIYGVAYYGQLSNSSFHWGGSYIELSKSIAPASGDMLPLTSDAAYTALEGKEPSITKGTTSQYFRGDMSLAAFPTSMPPTAHPLSQHSDVYLPTPTTNRGIIWNGYKWVQGLPDIGLAASGTRGGVQVGYTASGANLPVLLSSEKMYVQLNEAAINSVISYAALHGNSSNDFSAAALYASYLDFPSGWEANGNGGYFRFYYGGSDRMYLDTSGNLTVMGTATVGGLVTGSDFKLSDRRLKKHIKPIDFDKLDRVNWIQYVKKDDKSETIDYGVVAQDLQRIAPNLVRVGDDDAHTLSVNYVGLFAAKFAQLEEKIKVLESEVKYLRRKTKNRFTEEFEKAEKQFNTISHAE